MIENNTKYFEFKGYIDRGDFIWMSIVLYLVHRYLLFVIESNSVTNVTFVTPFCYLILVLVGYSRFCTFAKRILDITGEKENSGFHNLAAVFMALTSFGLNNQIILWVWLAVFVYCALIPGKYSTK